MIYRRKDENDRGAGSSRLKFLNCEAVFYILEELVGRRIALPPNMNGMVLSNVCVLVCSLN